MGGGKSCLNKSCPTANSPIDLYPIEHQDILALRNGLKKVAMDNQSAYCMFIHTFRNLFMPMLSTNDGKNSSLCNTEFPTEQQFLQMSPPGIGGTVSEMYPTLKNIYDVFRNIYCEGDNLKLEILEKNLHRFFDALCGEETINLLSAYGGHLINKHFVNFHDLPEPVMLDLPDQNASVISQLMLSVGGGSGSGSSSSGGGGGGGSKGGGSGGSSSGSSSSSSGSKGGGGGGSGSRRGAK